MNFVALNLNNVVVKRKTIESVQQPIQQETIEGLPFYYYFDIKTALLFIFLGVIAFVISIFGSGLFYFFLFKKKKEKDDKRILEKYRNL